MKIFELEPRSNAIKSAISLKPKREDFIEELRKQKVYEGISRAYTLKVDELSFQVAEKGSDSFFNIFLFDNSGKNGSCDCKDFVFQKIGTCKHLEAARRALNLYPEIKELIKSKETIILDFDPVFYCLKTYVHYENIKELGCSWDDEVESPNLLIIDDLKELLSAIKEKKCEISPSASKYLKFYLEQYKIEKERQKIKDLISSGSLSVDILKHSLYNFQKVGVEYILNQRRAILGDEQGTGKTPSSLAACEAVKRVRKETNSDVKILIVCLASLKKQWYNEILKFVPDVTSNDIFLPNNSKELKKIKEFNKYTIVNYELLLRNVERFQGYNFTVCILDEAQKIKNATTKSWQSISKIKSDFFFVLSGTIVENKLDDLYSVMQIIDPLVLGPQWEFDYTFKKLHSWDARPHGNKNLTLLRELINPYLLRRMKDQVLKDLPPMIEETVFVKLSQQMQGFHHRMMEQAKKLEYDALSKNRPLTLKEQQILQMLKLKARQACDDAALFGKSIIPIGERPKVEYIKKYIEDLCINQDKKLLIFTEWVEMQNILIEDVLKELGVGYTALNGTIQTKNRQALIDDFAKDDRKKVFLSTDAGGVGLNLQFMSHILHVDLSWNPAKMDQRNARVHRIGQKNPVSIKYLVAEDSIESKILDTLNSKRKVRSGALNQDSTVDQIDF